MSAEYEPAELSITSLGASGDTAVREQFLVEEPGQTVAGVCLARYVMFEVTDYTTAQPPRTALTLLTDVRHRIVDGSESIPVAPSAQSATSLPDLGNWVHRGEIMDLDSKERTMRFMAATVFMLTPANGI